MPREREEKFGKPHTHRCGFADCKKRWACDKRSCQYVVFEPCWGCQSEHRNDVEEYVEW